MSNTQTHTSQMAEWRDPATEPGDIEHLISLGPLQPRNIETLNSKEPTFWSAGRSSAYALKKAWYTAVLLHFYSPKDRQVVKNASASGGLRPADPPTGASPLNPTGGLRPPDLLQLWTPDSKFQRRPWPRVPVAGLIACTYLLTSQRALCQLQAGLQMLKCIT